jgi:hypothetical protein
LFYPLWCRECFRNATDLAYASVSQREVLPAKREHDRHASVSVMVSTSVRIQTVASVFHGVYRTRGILSVIRFDFLVSSTHFEGVVAMSNRLKFWLVVITVPVWYPLLLSLALVTAPFDKDMKELLIEMIETPFDLVCNFFKKLFSAPKLKEVKKLIAKRFPNHSLQEGNPWVEVEGNISKRKYLVTVDNVIMEGMCSFCVHPYVSTRIHGFEYYRVLILATHIQGNEAQFLTKAAPRHCENYDVGFKLNEIIRKGGEEPNATINWR